MTIKNQVQLLIIQLLDQCESSLWNDLGMTVSVFFLCRLKPPCTTCLHLVQTNLLNFTVSIVHYTLLYLLPCFFTHVAINMHATFAPCLLIRTVFTN